MPRGHYACPSCGQFHMNVHTHDEAMEYQMKTRTRPALLGVPVYRSGAGGVPEGFKPYGSRLNTLTHNGGNTFFQRRDQ